VEASAPANKAEYPMKVDKFASPPLYGTVGLLKASRFASHGLHLTSILMFSLAATVIAVFEGYTPIFIPGFLVASASFHWNGVPVVKL